jgi:dUTP pyrophosphatase
MNFQPIKYQLNIKVVSNMDAINNFYNNYSSHHLGDSGIDLITPHQLNCEIPFQVSYINLEIQCEMIDLETGNLCSYWLLPRSSISKTNFQLANSVGLIDAGYRGNIKAMVRNFMPNSKLESMVCYFQIVAPDLKPIKVVLVDELTTTSRNDGGFGSTEKLKNIEHKD